MTDAELRKRREEVLQRHLDAESDKDVEAVLDTMPDPIYDLFTVDRVLRGRDEVGGLLKKMFEALPDYRHTANRFHHADDNVVVEVVTNFVNGDVVKTVGVFGFDGPTLLSERVYVAPELLLPLLPD
ncbi:MAG TPA: nuclear transport factor 2 family protein [Acidimicrobiia bacterium]|jgi:ketosteroid isomerase-like protein